MVAVWQARPAANRVRVVVTCTNRKTTPVPASLRLGSITAVRTTTRLRSWTSRLEAADTAPTPALDLYAGEHWDVARRLSETSLTPVDLWVCSAGYGLVPADAPLKPYAATFAAGSPDSVPAPATAWWDALGEWEGPVGGSRSIAELVEADRSVRVLLVLSAGYLAACRDDLARTIDHLGDTRQLSIISAGTDTDGLLDEFLLPCDARLQMALGGTRQALNARIVSHLLSTGATEHAQMSDTLEKLLADQPALTRYDRRPASDGEVRTFIRNRLGRDPNVTHTRLLREFRDADRACEQGRFAALFRDEKGTRR